MGQGFQRIFFDRDTDMPLIRHGAVANIPALLDDGMSNDISLNSDSGDSGNAALAAVSSGRGGKSWKEKAGRSHGKDGYKFGDLTRRVMMKMKSKEGQLETNDLTASFADNDVSPRGHLPSRTPPLVERPVDVVQGNLQEEV